MLAFKPAHRHPGWPRTSCQRGGEYPASAILAFASLHASEPIGLRAVLDAHSDRGLQGMPSLVGRATRGSLL
eukprot:15482785-Alexandrium_andersonii.AAC.1